MISDLDYWWQKERHCEEGSSGKISWRGWCLSLLKCTIVNFAYLQRNSILLTWSFCLTSTACIPHGVLCLCQWVQRNGQVCHCVCVCVTRCKFMCSTWWGQQYWDSGVWAEKGLFQSPVRRWVAYASQPWNSEAFHQRFFKVTSREGLDCLLETSWCKNFVLPAVRVGQFTMFL